MGADPRFFERLGPVTARDIAARIGARLVRGGDAPVLDVATLDKAASGDLCYFASSKRTGRPGADSVVIVFENAGLDEFEACAAILMHPSPRAAYARAAPHLIRLRQPGEASLISASARIDGSARIGPGAIIGPDAHIGANCEIGAGSVIGPGVEIGAGTRIGMRAVIMCALIGADCDIYSGAVVGEAGFGLAYDDDGLVNAPHLGRVIIEDEVTLGANSTIDRGMFGDTRLRRGCRIDNLCHIAHNVDVGECTVMAAFAGISGSVIIGDGAQFGGRVGIADHMTIGPGARLAANAAVMTDVPGGETWAGAPAQPIRDFMRATAWLRRESTRRGKSGGGKDGS